MNESKNNPTKSKSRPRAQSERFKFKKEVLSMEFESVEYRTAFIEDATRHLTGNELRVLIVLESTKLGWPTVGQIAGHLRISGDRCRRALHGLSVLGLVEKDSRTGGYWPMKPPQGTLYSDWAEAVGWRDGEEDYR